MIQYPDLLEYNFLKTPFREHQEDVINTLVDFTLNSDKKYFIFQGTVGIGKSCIAATSMNYLSSLYEKTSYYTSPKNTLVDQAEDGTFGVNAAIIKGKANYDCIAIPNTKFEEGPCHLPKSRECPLKNQCPYLVARDCAKRNKLVVTNMHWLLNVVARGFSSDFSTRDLLVIDEGHTVESALIDFMTISYKETSIKKIVQILHAITTAPSDSVLYNQALNMLKTTNVTIVDANVLNSLNPNDINQVNALLECINVNLLEVIKIMDAVLGNFNPDILAGNLIKEYNAFLADRKFLHNITDKIELYKSLTDLAEWVCAPYRSKKTKKTTGIEVKPLMVDKIAPAIFEKVAKKIVFMSGTFGNIPQFCKDLGIEPTNVETKIIDSDFPVENRPIYLDYVGTIINSNKYEMWELEANKIDKLLEMYNNKKGLIHTTTFEQAEYFKTHCKFRDRIITHSVLSKEDALKMFVKSKDLVLCSPSCQEGMDFKDDLCRFQICAKIPWGDLGDNFVVARKNKDRLWYANNTAKILEQEYGRGVRSKTDWCDFYILDEGFERLRTSPDHLLSDYFLEAVTTEIPSKINHNKKGKKK